MWGAGQWFGLLTNRKSHHQNVLILKHFYFVRRNKDAHTSKSSTKHQQLFHCPHLFQKFSALYPSQRTYCTSITTPPFPAQSLLSSNVSNCVEKSRARTASSKSRWSETRCVVRNSAFPNRTDHKTRRNVLRQGAI